jgi:peptidoglycan/xylan/chitin deacetylase (PgdA/CDA1 family)
MEEAGEKRYTFIKKYIMKKTVLLCLLVCIGTMISAQTAGDTPVVLCKTESIPYAQYLPEGKLTVVASFDGSYSLNRWADILAFARTRGIKFTFFVSGVYFLSDSEAQKYIYPVNQEIRGKSDIGFGGTPQEVAARKKMVLKAISEGHDVESHLNGHFNAVKWTTPEWQEEFDEFDTIMSFLPQRVSHVRFPLLAVNQNVYPVLAGRGIKSVTSLLSKNYQNFRKVTVSENGKDSTIIEFPISKEYDQGTKVILMDYNFYLYDQSHHIDPAKAESEMISLYLEEADKCFRERRPFFISHHFSNWNHSAYWDAMKSVIGTISKKYPVEYMTVSDLYNAVTAGSGSN